MIEDEKNSPLCKERAVLLWGRSQKTKSENSCCAD
ncbi:hypothetical protein SGRA_3700 [Saprospira grandis str. Lewin]|uniref:Uncharacterized protein n=1 Tax=Saprospira grandis (strain Lewin) TaxID=984262 RepID=H6L6Z1_SAPGL|nr:hypothetical protein SGRA_3700 [Saprospira grandis str. Lewin]